jgi:hypothetical protein
MIRSAQDGFRVKRVLMQIMGSVIGFYGREGGEE